MRRRHVAIPWLVVLALLMALAPPATARSPVIDVEACVVALEALAARLDEEPACVGGALRFVGWSSSCGSWLWRHSRPPAQRVPRTRARVRGRRVAIRRLVLLARLMALVPPRARPLSACLEREPACVGGALRFVGWSSSCGTWLWRQARPPAPRVPRTGARVPRRRIAIPWLVVLAQLMALAPPATVRSQRAANGGPRA